MLSTTFPSAPAAAKKGKTMKRLTISLLTAVCAVAPFALVPADHAKAQSVSRPANDIVLSIGRGQLVTVGGVMADVFVADATGKASSSRIAVERKFWLGFTGTNGADLWPITEPERSKAEAVLLAELASQAAAILATSPKPE